MKCIFYILYTEKWHHPPTHDTAVHFTTHNVCVGDKYKSFKNGGKLTCQCIYRHISEPKLKYLEMKMSPQSLGFTQNISLSLAVGRDRRSKPHHRRPLPLEVCSLQLLLQRCGQKGEGKSKHLWLFHMYLCVFIVFLYVRCKKEKKLLAE